MYADWIKTRAELSPEKRAVIEPEKQNKEWTYQQMNQRAENLAAYFVGKGIQMGDRVALYTPNDISHLDFLFACTKIGAVYIPLNWRLKPDELSAIIADAGPKLIAYTDDLKARVSRFLDNRLTLVINSIHYDEIVLSVPTKRFTSVKVDNESPAVLIFTSGTTGKPKGAMITHRAMVSNATNTVLSWGLTKDDSTITLSPMFHTAGLFSFVIPLLMVGGEVIFQTFFEVSETLDLARLFKPTMIFMVPTMYYLLAQSDCFDPKKLSSVKLFVSGGAPISMNVLSLFYEYRLPLINSFGLTEVGPNNFYIRPEDAAVKINSVGKPTLFTKVKIVDESMEEVESNEIGELLIKSESAFGGYWNNPEETKRTFYKGYVRTGDLAKKDENGFYYIVGRKKELIITGGENVMPSEVEDVLNHHPLVKDSVVIGYPNDKWGESVAAAVILNDKQQNFAEVLNEYAISKLAGYKTPKKYIQLNEFPKNSVGKIDKIQLIDIILQEKDEQNGKPLTVE